MMWGGVPGGLAAAYGAAAGHPYGAMSAAAGMWPPHGQPGYGQPMKPQPPPPPKPDPVQKYCQFPLPGIINNYFQCMAANPIKIRWIRTSSQGTLNNHVSYCIISIL